MDMDVELKLLIRSIAYSLAALNAEGSEKYNYTEAAADWLGRAHNYVEANKAELLSLVFGDEEDAS